jgi:hypothetical protein
MQIVLALFECFRKKDKAIMKHGNLKPTKVLIDAKKRVKLSVFGGVTAG